MKTRYEINKLKALILYILKESGGTLDFITLFKKMYYVQQRYLVTYGKPAFSDKFRAVKLGQVPSFTYKAFRSLLDEDTHVSEEMKAFSQAFQVKEVEHVRVVSMREEPDMDDLAVAEVRMIDQVLAETQGMTPKKLSDKSHADSAWQNARKRAEDDPSDNYMSLVNIARAGGANKQVLEHIRLTQSFDAFCKL